MGGGDLSIERIRKEDERVFRCADLGRGDVIKARHSVGTGNRCPGLNQGGYSHQGKVTISGARKAERGVKTRTMNERVQKFQGKRPVWHCQILQGQE